MRDHVVNSSESERGAGLSWAQALLAAAVCVATGAFLLTEVYDLDVWWQVTIGRDILANWSVPTADRYAAAALGRPYHDSHWLFQVVLALSDRLAGMVGVQAVMVAIWAATLGFCQRAIRRWVPAGLSYALVFLVAMACVERFLPRPEIVTFASIAFFWWRLQEGRYRSTGDLAVLFLMQAVWANSHGLFVIGPFLVGCYWLAAVIGAEEGGRAEAGALSRLLVLVLAATLATPFGLENWRYALLLFQEAGPSAPSLLKSVGELSPTFGAASRSGVAFWFFAALLAAALLAVCSTLLQRRRLSLARGLALAGLFAAALTGRRNMVLFALAAAPFIAEQVRLLPAPSVAWRRWLPLAAAAAIFGWSWYPLSGAYHLAMEIPARFGLGATPSFFPHGLGGFLETMGFSGQVFNSNTIGGHYLYQGYPRRLPLTDGRWEIYEPTLFPRLALGAQSPAAWQRLVAEFDLRGVALQHASPETRLLLPQLASNPRWRLVYYDRAASFWVRGDLFAETAEVDLSAAGSLPPLFRLDDAIMLNLFLRGVGANELGLRNLQQALAFDRQRERLLADIGGLQIDLKRYAEAEETFRRLNREYPRNVTAYNELAFFAFQRGDLGAAESLLLRALEEDPANRDAQANYQRVRQALGRSTTDRSGESR